MSQLSRMTCLLFLFGAAGAACGHPGHDHGPGMRVWKDVDGLFELEATFLLLKADRVQLCKHDGTVVWVPLARLSPTDRAWVRERVAAIRRLNGVEEESPEAMSAVTHGTDPTSALLAVTAMVALVGLMWTVNLLRRRSAVFSLRGLALMLCPLCVVAAGLASTQAPPAIQKHFEPFKNKLKFRSDDRYFYVESNGLPDHPMMIGIRSWQQQVPLPQPYTGRNAWQIPLHPRLAEKPISARTNLYRGAIALAVNGVPIFNALNNRGEDAYLAGELDDFGGHCGRGDDYHYHIAPVHLEKTVGKGNPIAYALDGYPIYGFTDASGKEPKDLDEFNGRMEQDSYRYYSTKTYPYINGGMRGVVTVRGDQIEPQPRDAGVRPAGRPLRGARITGFSRDEAKKTYTLTYELRGATHSIRYTQNNDGSFTFLFTDGSGKQTTETYRRRERGNRPPPPDDRPPLPSDDRPPPRREEERQIRTTQRGKFTLTSPAVMPGGTYPVEFTGDGAGISPPLAWSGAPEGTKFYALQLWHKPFPDREEVKSYWVITDIPAAVTRLPKNARGIGRDGYNDKNRTGYDPMKSKGPGAKEYHISLYALSAKPQFDTARVTRANLLKAIQGITLAETTLSYTYERKSK